MVRTLLQQLLNIGTLLGLLIKPLLDLRLRTLRDVRSLLNMRYNLWSLLNMGSILRSLLNMRYNLWSLLNMGSSLQPLLNIRSSLRSHLGRLVLRNLLILSTRLRPRLGLLVLTMRKWLVLKTRLIQREIQTNLGVRTKLKVSHNSTCGKLGLLDIPLRGVRPRNILILYVRFLNIMMRDVMILNIRIW